MPEVNERSERRERGPFVTVTYVAGCEGAERN